MKLYTSYFANKVKLPPNRTISIAITAYTPDWWNGDTLSIVAPPKELVLYYKNLKNKRDTDFEKLKDFYIEYYTKTILNKLNPNELYSTLESIASMQNKENIVLLCFEKSSDFCHRHVLRDWLQHHGIQCEELDY